MSDRVTVEIKNGVADVRMTRPEKMNALDHAMFTALAETGESLKSDPSVRAVVLSGEGRAFCAGLDFSNFQSMADSGPRRSEASDIIDVDDDDRITHLGQQACWVWRELEVPVIAAVHGVALGGGIQVALGADLRYVTPDVRMSVLEIRWGLSPDMTATQILPTLVGPDVAKELTWSGREVNGEEAVRIGLATKVCDDPRADALAFAAEIAARSPHAIRAGKYLVDLAATADWAEGFAEERRRIGELIGSPNQVEAITAYFEKRDPIFADVDLD